MSKTRIVKVLLCKVGQAPIVHEFEHSLEAMQTLVGGNIECINIGRMTRFGGKDNVDLWCNEEGKLVGLPLNLRGPVDPLFPHDIIAGDFFLASNRNCSVISLSEKLVEKYSRLFADGAVTVEMTPKTT